MKAGRPALPANVHLLRGNPSKLDQGQLAAQQSAAVPVEAPTCPAFLSTKARTEWHRIVPHLITAGLLTQLDRAMLAAYCQAWGEWADLCELVKAKMGATGDDGKPRGADVLVDMTPSGYRQVSALAQARDRAFDRLMRTAREFGLSAASRIQANTGQQLALPGVDDPMEAFLAAGAPVRGAQSGGLVLPLAADPNTSASLGAQAPVGTPAGAASGHLPAGADTPAPVQTPAQPAEPPG